MYGFLTRTARSIFSIKIEMRFGKKGAIVKTAEYMFFFFFIAILYLKVNSEHTFQLTVVS